MTLSFEEIKFNNPGVLKTRLPSPIFDSLKVDIQEAIELKIPHNKHLVGNIAEEYTLYVKDYFRLIIRDMVDGYRKHFNFALDLEPEIPNTAWVNLQKKHEFNPVHHHNGALSWVVWAQIPYYLEDEMQVSSAANSMSPSSSLFEFYHTTNLGRIQGHPLTIDKFWEGNMVMFPAEMRHVVYPFFTSDDYRISVAGNVFIPDAEF